MKFKQYHWMLQEAKILTFLALPTSISYFIEGVHAKISNVFIGRSSGNEITMMLTALYIGQIFANATSYPITLGMAAYTNILCSQAYGAKQYRMVGLYFYRILFMSALLCFPLCALYISARPIVYHVTHDWELAYHVGRYTVIYCFALPAYMYHKVAIGYLQSSGIVWMPLLYLLLGSALNGILQYIFIFYYNTGLAGAAAGYTISMYLIVLLLYSHIRFTNIHILTNVNWTVEMIGEWYHTIQYALSTTIQMFAAIFSSGISPMIILGVIARSETQLTMYSILYSVWFVFCLFASGFGSAITIRVASILGTCEPARAKRVAVFALLYGFFVIIIISSFLCLTSGLFSSIFTTDKMLASELSFSLKILSVTILGDCVLFEQGIMNGCCLQRIDAIQKFVIRLMLGFIISIVCAHYVKWKALSLLMVMSISGVICGIIGLLIIFCQSWENFVIAAKQNTENTKVQVNSDLHLVKKHSKTSRLRWREKTFNSKTFISIRYCSCMLIGICLFSIVSFYDS